ncbi:MULTISPECIES: hypothetical protein [Cupriavidus]|uniref:Uncharacterized protein n=1 Tax=Cupriavidus pauculus TaxID=82633 RepID=A0A5P2HFB2_9BURK|nr:hypothetical protein [Cupriavidus pauculus]QET05839.1 hypothetical protein FOB72_28190 [Cupriavidus pauculus]
MQVTIDKPFQLELDVIATDEHVPSMKMDVVVRVQQFRHSLEYRGSMWFEYSCWETFVSSLNDGEARTATLTDMDACLVLALDTSGGAPEICGDFKSVALDGSIAKAACRFPADLEVVINNGTRATGTNPREISRGVKSKVN